MPDITEWAKGLGVFVILTMLTYFAYDGIISGILTWVKDSNSIVGAIGWVEFILLYIACAPGYLLFTIIAGAKGNKTDPKWILMGYSAFFLFIIIAGMLNMIFGGPSGSDGLIDSLDTATAGLIDSTTEINKISWTAVLISILLITAGPFVMILKGYGLLNILES